MCVRSSDGDEDTDGSAIDAAAEKEEDTVKKEDSEDDVMDEEDEEFLREFDEGKWITLHRIYQ